ncbi:acyltransferase [Dyadobacter sp. 676]|uniref:Acyltransferase n=1 Tax=Dyadobacter sp. 676 TaxID=3088362 RepID=A0AAU8FIS5_9BACT
MRYLYKQSKNNFNALRHIAAFFVIVSHAFDIAENGENEPLRRLTGVDFSFSYLGLSSFFLISGFLVTQSWIQKTSVKQYLFHRLLRIVPGLAVVVVLTILVYGPLFTTLPLRTYFGNIETYLYLKNILIFQSQGHLPGVFAGIYPAPINGSIWTLPYEMLFYICVPLFSPILFKTKLRSLVTGIAITLAVYWMLTNQEVARMYSPKVNMYRGSLVLFLAFFMSGSFFYCYHENIRFRKDYFWIISLVYIIVIASRDIILIKLLNPFLLGYMVFCLAFWPSPLNTFGKNRDLSYGIYIYAYPIQVMVIYYFNIQSAWFSLAITLLLVMPLAMFSWNFIEKPALKLRHMLKTPKLQRQIDVKSEHEVTWFNREIM